MREFSLAKLGHRGSHSEVTTTHRPSTKSAERPNRFKVSVSIMYTSALIGEGNVFGDDCKLQRFLSCLFSLWGGGVHLQTETVTVGTQN